jgi:tripartite-type tricarboxylate transporter receptor subunit TctC
MAFSMNTLVAATAAFLLTHFVASTPLRAKLVGAMGEWPYRGAYSLVAFLTLGWMIWAYAGAAPQPLWSGFRDIPRVVMPVAFILIACGYWRNPTMVGADRLLKSDDPARGIIRITRHPIMWGIMLWAAAHILARGELRALVFFGGFLVVAALGTVFMDLRKKSNPGWSRFAAVTSHVPFVAIAQGRNRIVWCEIGWLRPAIGVAVFVLVFLVHPWISGGAHAQAFPQRPLRMLVGFAPGGANDILARILAQKLSESMAQPVVVENRPGNAGLIAAELLAKAPPDGYTLMLGSTGTQTIAPHLTPKLPFDALHALAPVSLVGVAPSALVVHAGVPAHSVQELIALAKSRKGRPLTYASSGNGTTLHLGGELFRLMAGIELVHVAYRGNAPALNDIIGGQVDMMFSALPPLLPHARAGKLRVLGIGALERHRLAPEVPTIAEQGLPGYVMGTWYGVFATAGSPAAALERLGAEVRKSVEDPKVRETIAAQGADAVSNSPAEFRRFFDQEFARWGKLVKEAGIKAD